MSRARRRGDLIRAGPGSPWRGSVPAFMRPPPERRAIRPPWPRPGGGLATPRRLLAKGQPETPPETANPAGKHPPRSAMIQPGRTRSGAWRKKSPKKTKIRVFRLTPNPCHGNQAFQTTPDMPKPRARERAEARGLGMARREKRLQSQTSKG